jgi:hypothetical protein
MTDTIIITEQDEIEVISTVENGGVVFSSNPADPVVISTPSQKDVIFSTDDSDPVVISVIEQGPQGIPGGVTSFIAEAAIPLGGHRVIALGDDGMAVYADNTNQFKYVVGISTNAVNAGDSIVIKIFGEMSESSWSWDKNKGLFLTTNGLITQDAPPTGVIISIGFVINLTTIFVRIGERIER